MSMITLLVVAIAASGLLVAGVRAVMTHALEHDRSFRTDLDFSVENAVPSTGESA